MKELKIIECKKINESFDSILSDKEMSLIYGSSKTCSDSTSYSCGVFSLTNCYTKYDCSNYRDDETTCSQQFICNLY